MKLLALTMIFLSWSVFAQSDDLSAIAKKTLLKNVHNVNKTYFLSAGNRQFKSFWTRDFAFSAKGLLLLKQDQVVKDHLDYLFAHQREDHLVPLYVDSLSPMLRVVNETMNRALGIDHDLKIKKNIKPYYLVNGKYPAIDSNLLTLIAAREYLDFTQDTEWFHSHEEDFKNIFRYYDSLLDNGLIIQEEHSDWQDSASREGKTFFTNLLYYQVARDFGFLSSEELLQLKEKIIQSFYDESTGLYKTRKNFAII